MTGETVSARDFLVEIGTEELPPKALTRLSESFTSGVVGGLVNAGISHGEVRSFAAPRRLAIFIKDVLARQPDKATERRGPALAAAFDVNGMPTKATQGFARSCGVDVDRLERLETDKGAWLVFRSMQHGVATPALIPDIVDKALAGLPIPKRMRWADRDAEFVRPVHWVLLLWGDSPIDATILGVRAGQETRGHRFHHPAALFVAEPAAYLPLLETEGRVMPDFASRREAIFAQVTEAAKACGGKAVLEDELLDEVTALVEWPSAVRGKFDERYLDVPEEALVSTMQGHQRYFAVRGGDGKLLPYFITIANIESKDPAVVRAGNERVIRPRLEDAMFFFQRDLATPLVDRAVELKNVVFQKQLGTLHDKTARIVVLSGFIARQLGLDGAASDEVHRAAQLCKCDLLTSMVGEFPELQGIMGRRYAERQGEPSNVSQALFEHYLPRYAGDQLPQTVAGRAVAIADKLDTLCGIFSIGMIPTGDKDPFALRRAALGVLRIMIESASGLDLRELLTEAVRHLPASGGKKKPPDDLVDAVFHYMMERLRAYYADAGVRSDVFEAVLIRRPTVPSDFHRRIEAVSRFRRLPEAESLAGANKRIANILRQAGVADAMAVDEATLEDPAEIALWKAISELTQELEPLWVGRHYEQALMRLATLKEIVDAFFDKVMVMAEDRAVRANRLALLSALRSLFLRVADISCLQG